MNSEDRISNKLGSVRPALGEADRAAIWSEVEKKITAQKLIKSPYKFLVSTRKILVATTLALILMLSTSGLIVAEAARPGDPLFVVNQAVENVRLALASPDTRTRLEAEFAAERLLELSSLIEESLQKSRAQNYDSDSATTSRFDVDDKRRIETAVALSLEQFSKSNLDNQAKDSLYDELATILNTTAIEVDDDRVRWRSKDNHEDNREDEDRDHDESRDDERLEIREKDSELRIKTRNTEYISNYYTPVRESNTTNKESDENDESEESEDITNQEPEEDEVEVENRDEDRDHDESRDDNDQDDDITSGPGSDQVEDSNSNESGPKVEIDVKVENNQAEVKVEIDDTRSEFDLPYTTTDKLISDIVANTGLSSELVKEKIDLEIED